MTVTQLARQCGLSRTTVLYYESAGLLHPARRAASNYRTYLEQDLERLRQIRSYRSAGLTIADIRLLLEQPDTDAASVLTRRLQGISVEIERLKAHQRAIARLLQAAGRQLSKGDESMTKEKWVAIMKRAGFSEPDMRRWHVEFEHTAPDEHQQFLEYLNIPGDEVQSIRAWSASEARG
jgi:DNA-binding transcriptional MerR regulator